MTEEIFNRAQELENEISVAEHNIERCNKVLKNLEGNLPQLTVGCKYDMELFEVDSELREEMRQHYRGRIRRLEQQIGELKIQFNNL